MAFDGEHRAFGIGGHPGGASQAGANRNHLAIRRDLHGPTAEEVVGLVGTAQTESDPDVAIRVVLGSEGKFVSFGITPVVSEGEEVVGLTIAIGILEAGDFAELGDGEGVVAP